MLSRGLFKSILDDDPFFREPFGHMEKVMSAMFRDPFGETPQFGALRQKEERPVRHNATVIEEVNDDEYNLQGSVPSRDQPIVDEPDDRPQYKPPDKRRAASTPRARTGDFPMMFSAFNMQSLPKDAKVYGYSAAYTSIGGPKGVSYAASSVSRMGPNGVRETQSVVHDGNSGKKAYTVERGLGQKERIMAKIREASGKEDAKDILKNIEGHEVETFEKDWYREAERNLPGGAKNFFPPSQALGAARREVKALPSSAEKYNPGYSSLLENPIASTPPTPDATRRLSRSSSSMSSTKNLAPPAQRELPQTRGKQSLLHH